MNSRYFVRREVEPLAYSGNIDDGHSIHNRIKTKKGEKLWLNLGI